MKNYNEHIYFLIIQYSKGIITPEETEELLFWLGKDVENKSFFKEQLAILRSTQMSENKFETSDGLSEIINVQKKVHISLALKIATIAAAIIIIVLLGNLINNQSEPQMVEYYAQENNKQTFLSDSTEVTLSTNSKLFAPKEFSVKKRNVELEGKAFFDVTKDKNRPFTISCQKILIKVVGTSFEVNMDTLKDLVTVTVASGIVSVNHPESGFKKLITKNNQLTLSQKGKIINETQVNNENYLFWKSGSLVFKNYLMKDVAKELTQIYGKDFIFADDSIKNEYITLNLHNQSVNSVIETLKMILQIEIKEKENSFIVSKK